MYKIKFTTDNTVAVSMRAHSLFMDVYTSLNQGIWVGNFIFFASYLRQSNRQFL